MISTFTYIVTVMDVLSKQVTDIAPVSPLTESIGDAENDASVLPDGYVAVCRNESSLGEEFQVAVLSDSKVHSR